MFFLGSGSMNTPRAVYEEAIKRMASPLIASVITKVDRKYYTQDPNPYSLSPVPIHSGGVNMSAPSVHALALELSLKYKGENVRNVLDVGSGSGYLVACFGQLFPQANVWGVERLKGLVEQSRLNLQRDPECASMADRFHIVEGNALDLSYLNGLPQMDVIHMGTAHHGLPKALVSKLNPGGILIFPEEHPQGEQFFSVYRKNSEHMQLVDEGEPVIYIRAEDKNPE